MTNPPLVSIFIPVYNQDAFVGQAIQSALCQTYTNIEVVIGDDASTDLSWEIIKRFKNAYPDIVKAYRNDINLGITGNCNKLLQHCGGDFIAFHAGDDIFLPSKVQTQVDTMLKNSECILCYHNIEVFDGESGATIRHWNSGPEGVPPVEGDSKFLAAKLVEKGTRFMAALSVMAKRSALPCYDERVPVASDWLMWINACAENRGEICYVNQILARYRKHAKSITSAFNSRSEIYLTLAIVESSYPWLRNAVRRARSYNFYKDAVDFTFEANYNEARENFVLAARLGGCSWKWVIWWMYTWVLQLREISRTT